MPLAATGRDPDRLVTAYRTALSQETLFDLGGGPLPRASGSTGYDEFVDAAGRVRPAWRELAELIGERGDDGLDRLRDGVRAQVDNDGISYAEVDRPAGVDPGDLSVAVQAPWPLDGIPLMLSAADWETVETAMVQRAGLLDAVLADLYGERTALTGGIVPPQLLFGHPGYVRAARGIENPGRNQLFMIGCDISRAADGAFRVNADRTQAPSGIGYALADRRVLARAMPDVYDRVRPRPASPFAQALRLALIDAAPASAEEPVVVVLSPGIHSETAFDQAYLATVLGFPLVESADLVMREGKLWMRSLGTRKRVDVVLRRVDAEFADPLDLRPDSRLGVAGLVEAQRRGSVTVVNTLGSGILESPGLQRFLPEIAERLTGERPIMQTPQLYWGGLEAERRHLIARLPTLLIKSALGAKTIVGPALSEAQRADLTARIESNPSVWLGQELPQFSSAPTAHYPGGLTAASVGLRVFTVSQRNGYAPMVGGLGYVLAPGYAALRLKSVAAKDIWVRQPERAGSEQSLTIAAPDLPGGTQFISSPRVLSDMFWIGRYAERAEALARLLIVTRDRFYEYHRRRDTDGGQCMPALLGALAEMTGTAEEPGIATAPQEMWSLTVDRQRPGSLAHSVERLGSAARAVRDQMSNDTWMVLGAVERALGRLEGSGPGSDDGLLASAQQRTLAGMLALSGMTAESMVHDAGWTMMDVGKRIERGVSLTALLGRTLTVVRAPETERVTTESVLVACESSVIYRRLNLGRVSVSALADLVLFDDANPRSLVYQIDRLRADLRALPGSSGSSKAERMADDVGARLRRVEPEDLEETDRHGNRAALADLLTGIHTALTGLSDFITRTQLTLPGEMQPLWGPDERRMVP